MNELLSRSKECNEDKHRQCEFKFNTMACGCKCHQTLFGKVGGFFRERIHNWKMRGEY